MNELFKTIIKENETANKMETLKNLNVGIKLVLESDNGRLTRKEQEVLGKVGQQGMIELYADAIIYILNN